MSIIPALVKGDSCSDFMMGPATGLAATATAAIEAYKASKVRCLACYAPSQPCYSNLPLCAGNCGAPIAGWQRHYSHAAKRGQ